MPTQPAAPPVPAPPPQAAFGETLQRVQRQLPPGSVTLAEIRDLIGADGLLVLTIFLSLIFMVPVSIPGVSTVFGLAILLIGVSRCFNRSLWLPRTIAQRRLPADRLRTAIDKGSVWVKRLERLCRPHRLDRVAASRAAAGLHNAALVFAAVLLMAPFGFVPFSNTLPALALLLLAVGLLQRDGWCILLGHLANVFTVLYFAILVAGGGVAILEIFRRLTERGA